MINHVCKAEISPMRSRRITRDAAGILLLCVAWLLPACSINPATGQRQFNVLSQQREIALGEEASPQFLAEYGGPIPSPAIREYVSNIGLRLASVSERPNLPWEFHVVDSEVINAFALPGGKVFMSRGLLAKMNNEAQLAGVLGHEVGHVTAQHIGQQMSQAIAVQAVAVGLGIAGAVSDEDWLKVLGVGANVGGGLYLLSFGRNQEIQSDELGVRYMTKLGYDPNGQVQVMKILKQASGGGGSIEFLSTHPLPDTRIEHLEKRIAAGTDLSPGPYRFYEQRFKTNVLDELKKLDPPKHRRQAKLPIPPDAIGVLVADANDPNHHHHHTH